MNNFRSGLAVLNNDIGRCGFYETAALFQLLLTPRSWIAQRQGSVEEEVRNILRNAANDEDAPSGGLGRDISNLFAKVGLDAGSPELRGNQIKPGLFEP